MSIGQNIRQRRKSINMTLEDVAKDVGVSRQTLSRYETGVIGNIPSDKIELLAKILCTTPAYLMGWEDNDLSPKVDYERRKEKKMKEKGNSPFFTPEEVAERYRVDFTTVHRWIRNGWLSALDLGCGKRFGPYLITQKDLDEFEDRRHREATVEKVPPLGLEIEEEPA